MSSRNPIEFPRAVTVEAGKEEKGVLKLFNCFGHVERFELSVRQPKDTGPTAVAATVDLDPRVEQSLYLRLKPPSNGEPGFHPFALRARLASDGLELNIPGLMVVPAVGVWDAAFQTVNQAVTQTITSDRSEKAAAEIVVRPSSKGTNGRILLTNESSDWLYCKIEILDQNTQWHYDIASWVVCLRPWTGAVAEHKRASGSYVPAMKEVISDAPLETQSGPVEVQRPAVEIPLEIYPLKRTKIGTPPDAQAETNCVIRVSRLDPETAEATNYHDFPVRVVQQPWRNPWDAIQPSIQWIRTNVLSKKGLFTLAGIIGATYLLVQGPALVYYTVRDFLQPPKIVAAGFRFVKPPPEWHVGDTVVVNYEVEHVDQVVISGLPGDAIPGELGHALDPEHPEKVPPQSGTVSFKVGSKPSYTLEISAARSRPRIWIWPLNLPKKEAPPINRTLDVPVSQKPVEVPDLTGMTFVEAGKAASSFTVQPGQPVKEATAKEGTVVSQEPKADTLKAPGETIVVHLAEGSTVPPPQPDVALKEPVGQPAAVVRAALQSKGIVPTEETRSGAGLPGTVLESIPADLTTVQPGGAAKLVISEKKVLEQTGGVWQVGGGTAGQYAQWAAEALNTQPATGGPPAQCALVVVGPDMPPPGLTVPAGAAVLGIGPGGRAFLSRIDAEHFKAMKDATGSNAADVNIHDLKDRLFGGKTPPLRYQQQAFSASAPAHIAAHPIPMFPIDGTRLDGGAPLTQLYRENRALVGWSTNRGYWGFRDVGTFSPGMKETFQALVRQITTP